ncbi:MAG TPA: V-type ATP synthase subunit E [Anaerolineae bacterium]|nr:V-type ATP synthase subunit E [Anaerolineae bacterium]
MSLDRILQALEAEAEQQVVEIEQAAQAEVENILRQAQAEAAAVRQKRLAASQSSLQVERTRLLNRAKQSALQVVLKAREALIISALETAAQHLAALSTTEVYSRLLRLLTQEVVDNLGTDQPLCLHVRPCDVELMHQIVREMGLSATVVGDLADAGSFGQLRFAAPESKSNGLGGLAVTIAAGRISLINTLEMRLQRVAQLSRAQIAGIIFDHRQDG